VSAKTPKVDLHDLIEGICGRLGVAPADVGQIVLTPTTATLTIFENNENGNHYLDEDNDIAQRVQMWAITS
jgi:hypothetical protein